MGCIDCTKLCNVQFDFSAVAPEEFKLKNRHFWNKREKYYKADYLIKVVIGPADINFELCRLILLSLSHNY